MFEDQLKQLAKAGNKEEIGDFLYENINQITKENLIKILGNILEEGELDSGIARKLSIYRGILEPIHLKNAPKKDRIEAFFYRMLNDSMLFYKEEIGSLGLNHEYRTRTIADMYFKADLPHQYYIECFQEYGDWGIPRKVMTDNIKYYLSHNEIRTDEWRKNGIVKETIFGQEPVFEGYEYDERFFEAKVEEQSLPLNKEQIEGIKQWIDKTDQGKEYKPTDQQEEIKTPELKSNNSDDEQDKTEPEAILYGLESAVRKRNIERVKTTLYLYDRETIKALQRYDRWMDDIFSESSKNSSEEISEILSRELPEAKRKYLDKRSPSKRSNEEASSDLELLGQPSSTVLTLGSEPAQKVRKIDTNDQQHT